MKNKNVQGKIPRNFRNPNSRCRSAVAFFYQRRQLLCLIKIFGFSINLLRHKIIRVQKTIQLSGLKNAILNVIVEPVAVFKIIGLQSVERGNSTSIC